MTPRLYFGEPRVDAWVFHGDIREAAGVLGPQRFSLVLADSPYVQTSCEWDRWPEGWLHVVREPLAPEGSLWCWGTLRLFMERAEDFRAAGWRLAQDCVWEKHNGSKPVADRFLPVHEQVAHFYPESAKWTEIYRDPQRVPAPPARAHRKGGSAHRRAEGSPAQTGAFGASTWVDDGTRLQRSVWQARSLHRQGAGHATPKPLEVLEPLVRYSCPPGGWVLVPFSRSGSEVEACLRNERKVVAFDTDERCCAMTAERIRRVAGEALATKSIL